MDQVEQMVQKLEKIKEKINTWEPESEDDQDILASVCDHLDGAIADLKDVVTI